MTSGHHAGAARRASMLSVLACAALGVASACGGNNGSLELFPPGPSAPLVGEKADARTGSGSPSAHPNPATSGADAAPPRATADARPPPPCSTPSCPVTPPCPDAGCSPAGCRSDMQCQSGSASRCDTLAGQCVECLATADCTSGDRPICDGAAHLCVECLTDADCHDPSKPGCLKSTGRCQDCSATAPCPAGQTCDVTQGQCR